MNSVLILFPFLTSLLLGYLVCGLCLGNTKNRDRLLELFLSGGLGLGLSSFLTFFAFVLKDGFHPPSIFILHLAALVVLFSAFRARGHAPKKAHVTGFDPARAAGIVILLLFLWPVWVFANYYPFGGWDAWTVWNFKAKFLFLAGERWKELFLPELWRSSPHYPLLLPMVNIWIWCFTKTPLQIVPLITGIVFTMTAAGVLMFSLMKGPKKLFALLAPALMLSLPHFLTMAVNQYADIVLAYYLLAAGVCLHRWLSLKEDGYGFLAALLLGCLAFTKPEGFAAAGIFIFSALVLTVLIKDLRKNTRSAVLFLLIFAAAMLPALLFRFLYSPGNQTFINGFLSAENPSTFLRLRLILAFYTAEWVSTKWNGFGGVVLAGILLGVRQIFFKQNLLFPLFLFFYLCVVIIYYWTNTYWEIQWFLSTTLTRIIAALIPLTLFWVFSAALKEDRE